MRLKTILGKLKVWAIEMGIWSVVSVGGAIFLMFCWLEPLLWTIIRKPHDLIWWGALLSLGVWMVVTEALWLTLALSLVALVSKHIFGDRPPPLPSGRRRQRHLIAQQLS